MTVAHFKSSDRGGSLLMPGPSVCTFFIVWTSEDGDGGSRFSLREEARCQTQLRYTFVPSRATASVCPEC